VISSIRPSDRSHGCRIDVYEREGQTVVVLENALVRVTVTPTKGADITEFRLKALDLDFLWHGPHHLYELGAYVPPRPSSRGAFLDYFTGGWQEVLPNGGGPCTYLGADLGQHGEVSLLPWAAEIVRDDPDGVSVRLSVRTHRTPFRLERTLSIDAASPTLRIEEKLTNEGREELAYMWGHHPGFGPPFVAPGAVIDLPGGTVVTHGEGRKGGRLAGPHRTEWPLGRAFSGADVRLDVFPGLDAESDEDFHVENLSGGWAALRNPDLGTGLALKWELEVFPYLWIWLVASGSWGYPFYGRLVHVALEPFSSPIGNLVVNDERGTAPHLGPGASIETELIAAPFVGQGRCIGFEGRTPLLEGD
jgi:hypothetical protein